jgi:inner membrane protein
MASPVSHAILAVTIGLAFPRPRPRSRYWLAAALAILPDIDAIGFFSGIEYGSLLGHRGLTHSLAFAAVLAGILITIPVIASPTWGPRWSTCLYLFLACASHGLLDAMTDGGMGVAFFSPFSNTRYFLPWQPIVVGPINILDAFSQWGRRIALSELKWVIGPCAAIILATFAIRKKRGCRNMIIKEKHERSL